MNSREKMASAWVTQVIGKQSFSLRPLSGDASFRRYYRLQDGALSRILMDAPPEKESIEPFLNIRNLLAAHGIAVPHVHAVDIAQGFLLLDDLGDILLLDKLTTETVEKLYQSAIVNLLAVQAISNDLGDTAIPVFDRQFILGELALFETWFLNAYLKIDLSSSEKNMLNETFSWLTAEVLKEEKVLIHRDYHSRNIMLPDTEDFNQQVLIDFQDAMLGPLSYDLASLLKDCYIQWPKAQITRSLTFFYEKSPRAQRLDFASFTRSFELCGLQRHLKVLGVFSRLYLRDGKSQYLKNLPLTLHYVRSCLETFAELKPLYAFMQTRIRAL